MKMIHLRQTFPTLFSIFSFFFSPRDSNPRLFGLWPLADLSSGRLLNFFRGPTSRHSRHDGKLRPRVIDLLSPSTQGLGLGHILDPTSIAFESLARARGRV